MITAIVVAVGILWALSIWGRLPHDKNGRTDR